MRTVTTVEGKWLLEVAPHYYKDTEIADSANKKMPKTKGKAMAELTKDYGEPVK